MATSTKTGGDILSEYQLAVDGIITYLNTVDVANLAEICRYVFLDMERTSEVIRLIKAMTAKGWVTDENQMGRYRVTQAGLDR